jgi:hypothetical protein
LGVFVFHAAHPFDLFDWHVKNDQRSFALTVTDRRPVPQRAQSAAGRAVPGRQRAPQPDPGVPPSRAPAPLDRVVPRLRPALLARPGRKHLEPPARPHPAWFGRLDYHLWFLGFLFAFSAFAALVALDAPAWLQRWSAHPGYSWEYLPMTGLLAVDAWSWTVAAVSLGMRSQRFRALLPRPIGELGLPFYVLHQPVILAIALLVVRARAGIS